MAPRIAPYFLRKIYGHSAWMTGARPSVVGTFTLKTVFQRASEHTIFIQKIEKFSGEGPSPSQDPTPMKGEKTYRTHSPRPLPSYQNPKYATVRVL